MGAQKNGSAEEQEPSMEEILSSIKKIISDDEQPDGEPKMEATQQTNGKADDDVLELTEVIEEPKKNGKADKKSKAETKEIDADIATDASKDAAAKSDLDDLGDQQVEDDIAFEADFDEPSEDMQGQEDEKHEHTKMSPEPDTGLISADTAKASTSAFSKLTRAVQGQDDLQLGQNGKTVEAFVAELLEPSLKDWLDGNLERVVQTVVEQEVKKLARRAELL